MCYVNLEEKREESKAMKGEILMVVFESGGKENNIRYNRR